MKHIKSRKKFVKSVCIIVAILLVFSTVAAMFILDLARQPEPETGYEYADSFLTTYDEVREHLE